MSTFKTQALILTKRPLKEADRLYVLYTKDYGKIEAKVKSAASSKSKLAGQLEPIALSQVMIVKGKGLETIAGAQLVERFIFSETKIQALASLAAEMVIKFIKPGLPDIRIYQLLLSFFKSLAVSTNINSSPLSGKCYEDIAGAAFAAPAISSINFFKQRLLTLRFIWQFLSLLGYQINLTQKKSTDWLSLSPDCCQLLNDCLKEKSQLTILQSSSKVVEELVNFTKEYLRYFAESDFKSYNYLRMYE